MRALALFLAACLSHVECARHIEFLRETLTPLPKKGIRPPNPALKLPPPHRGAANANLIEARVCSRLEEPYPG